MVATAGRGATPATDLGGHGHLVAGHIQGRVQSSPDQESVNIVGPNHDLAGLM